MAQETSLQVHSPREDLAQVPIGSRTNSFKARQPMEPTRPLQCGPSGQISFRQSCSDIAGQANAARGKAGQDLSCAMPNDSTPRSN